MYGARGVPPPRKNEQADEEVQHAHNAQIIFNRCGPGRWLDYQLHLKLFAASHNLIAGLRPESDAPQTLGDVDRVMNGHVIDGQDLVAGSKSGICGGRFWGDMPGDHCTLLVNPRHPVIGSRKKRSLLEIDDAEDDCGERCQSKNCRAQANPKTVVEWSAQCLSQLSPNEIKREQRCFQII